MRYTMTLRLLQDGKRFFGPGVVQLAERIENGLSLRQAAQDMGMAYSKAWRIMNDFESATGFPLVHRKRGGSGGGGSTLTPQGQRLLDGYRLFREKAFKQCDRLFAECLGEFAQERGSAPPEPPAPRS